MSTIIRTIHNMVHVIIISSHGFCFKNAHATLLLFVTTIDADGTIDIHQLPVQCDDSIINVNGTDYYAGNSSNNSIKIQVTPSV